MMQVKSLSAGIGKIGILFDIDISVAKGALVSIVGANGAGKTTLLRSLSRLQPLSSGQIVFDGKDINGLEAKEVAQSGLVHVPQGRQVIPGLTVEDNLLLGSMHIPGLSRSEINDMLEREYKRFPVLRERSGIAGGSLSGGEQQMLAISRALMMKPKLLMLDEPSLGLAPRVVEKIAETICELCKAGVSILLVEQAVMMALKIADYGYVLRNGRVAMSGPADALLRDRSLVKSYLS